MAAGAARQAKGRAHRSLWWRRAPAEHAKSTAGRATARAGFIGRSSAEIGLQSPGALAPQASFRRRRPAHRRTVRCRHRDRDFSLLRLEPQSSGVAQTPVSLDGSLVEPNVGKVVRAHAVERGGVEPYLSGPNGSGETWMPHLGRVGFAYGCRRCRGRDRPLPSLPLSPPAARRPSARPSSSISSSCSGARPRGRDLRTIAHGAAVHRPHECRQGLSNGFPVPLGDHVLEPLSTFIAWCTSRR